MSLRFPERAIAAGAWAALGLLATAASLAAAPPLRVCADPNNMPFSNAREQGFENALARLVAADLGAKLEYTWWPQRRGFIRNTLNAGRCDVVMGVPEHYGLTSNTRPYYRSTYVFVTRRGANAAPLQSLTDPRLAAMIIGVHVIGDDYASVPPAGVLAARGLAANLRGYSIYGDYSKPDPPMDLLEALARGAVDVAIAWGPQAGWYARHARTPLSLNAIETAGTEDAQPMQFAIAIGVRKNDRALRDRLDSFVRRRRAEIERLLVHYGVPLVPVEAPARRERAAD